MRVHKSKLPDSPVKPPNALLSRKSDSEGVFDFDGVLQREDDGTTHEFAPASICSNAEHSDVDSFYSDAELANISYGNNIDDADDVEPDDNDNGSHGDDDYSSDESDFSDGTYLASDTDDTDDSLMYDFEEEELSSSDDEDNLPNYTPRPFPDDHVPFSENIYSRNSKKVSPATIVQLQISELLNRNKASIAMHDKLIDIINAYFESVQPPPTAKLLHCWQFLDKMEKLFNKSDLKPTYGSVHLTNNTMVTVPVFDMKAMILSIVHDERLMHQENFAPGGVRHLHRGSRPGVRGEQQLRRISYR